MARSTGRALVSDATAKHADCHSGPEPAIDAARQPRRASTASAHAPRRSPCITECHSARTNSASGEVGSSAPSMEGGAGLAATSAATAFQLRGASRSTSTSLWRHLAGQEDGKVRSHPPRSHVFRRHHGGPQSLGQRCFLTRQVQGNDYLLNVPRLGDIGRP